MSYNKIVGQINDILDKNIEKLDREIEEYENKARDNESFYGLGGGPAGRQHKAAETRREDKERLETLKKGYGNSARTFKLKLYYITCNECGATIFSTDFIKKGYHECPCCGKTVFKDPSQVTEIEVVEDSKLWLQAIREKTLQEVQER